MKVGVCRGKYCRELVKAWKLWDKRHRSENDPVDGLGPSQAFLIISMADCGSDLEKYPMPGGFDEAVAVLAQVSNISGLQQKSRVKSNGDALKQMWDGITLAKSEKVSNHR